MVRSSVVRSSVISIVVAVALGASLIGAQQPPNLGGTWRLDESASTVAEGASYVGLGGNAGVPTTLYVTHASNGVVIVGSNMNTSHARTYRPDASGSGAPAVLERIGDRSITMTSGWTGSSLVAEGQADGAPLRETLDLSENGDELVVTIASGPSGGSDELTTTLLYRRVHSEPPCAQWSTPCRDFAQSEPQLD